MNNHDSDLDAEVRNLLSMAAALIRAGESLDGIGPPDEKLSGSEWVASVLDQLARMPVAALRMAAGLDLRKRGGRDALTQMDAILAVVTAAISRCNRQGRGDYMVDAAAALRINRRTLQRRIDAGLKKGLIPFGVAELCSRMPPIDPPKARRRQTPGKP